MSLALLLGFLSGWFVFRLNCETSREALERVSDTVRVTVVDTVKCVMPVAVDSVVVRYVTLAVAEGDGSDGSLDVDSVMSLDVDSVMSLELELPITQKRYETVDYLAYVSGYDARLDSIFVYPRTEKETITTEVMMDRTRTLKDRFSFGVGVGAGYGIIHRRADIYVGANVSFRLWP